MMRRRDFMTFLGGAAATWPHAARAQQSERVRRVGILSSGVEDNSVTRAQLTTLREELAKLGWIEGRNLRIDLRFTATDPERVRTYTMELVSLAPDVIITTSRPTTIAAQQQTKSIPIVFAAGGDPASNRLVQNITRPEGNTTGITNATVSLGGKWLEVLKEAFPHIARVALVFNPETVGPGYLPAIEAAAPLLGVQTIRTPFRDPLEVVRVLDEFAREPNGGLMTVPVVPVGASYEMVIRLAAAHRLPAVYYSRVGVAAGGLMTYDAVTTDLYRRAAAYVDRILRGAKVSELPVQFPTKFELVINLKAAKAIGLEIPATLLARADEVIK